jgi:molecular chaperone HtpG
MTVQLHDTSVCMDGLLEVLGKNLYSTPSVAIRELVQNAHDACIRLKLEQPGDHDLTITLTTNPGAGILSIEDTGSGLTYDEVISFLATVGSGYTRRLRDENPNTEMIGYFGLGFLSAYVVAEKVDVWTTSYQTPDKTWHFSSRGGKRFAIAPCEGPGQNRGVGTLVQLKLSDKYRELSSPEVLHSLLRKYCCLLPVPIYINDEQKAVNNLSVPWLLDAQTPPLRVKKEQLAFAELFEDTFNPICVIAIPADNAAKISGLIWIQDSSGYATSDFRNVSVFIRNMFITDKKREMLPLVFAKSIAIFITCLW